MAVTTCTSSTQYINYSYDENGNKLTEDRVGVTGPGTIKYTYDAADQMINRTNTDGSVVPLTYNADGQLQDGRQWDVLGRVSQETVTGKAVNFTYDAMDLRRTVQDATGTKKLSWDINNPLPMLGVETRADGSQFRHRYAPDGSAVYIQHASKSYPRSLMFPDAIGSVTDVVDQTGAARWRYGYEPFGAKRTNEKLNTVAEDPQIGFTGAYLETSTGNYNLRARDLHPWGMFLAPDPLTPTINDPHITAYAYANQRPTLLTDPSGRIPDLPGWLQEGLVGFYGGTLEMGEFGPQGQATAALWKLATGKTQLEWYYQKTSDIYGIDGSSDASHVGSLASALIPIGGGAGVVCRLGEAERFGFLLGRPSVKLAANAGADIGRATFAQRSFSETFSKGGLFGGRTIDDVAGSLRSGALSPKDIPIDVIVRDGNTLILNTRSSQALLRAGIPRGSWNVIDRTGQAAYEARLSGQLGRNGLTSSGTELP